MAKTAAGAKREVPFDRLLFIAVLLLLGIGIVMVYSASGVQAAIDQRDPAYFLLRQAVWIALGLTVMLLSSRINYHFYPKIVYPLLGFAVVALMLCHTPLGRTVNGATRWVAIGPLAFQPSEVAKIALVLWLSYSLAQKSLKIKSFAIGFLPHLLVPGLVIILCLLEPDFGTAVVLAVITFVLLFIAGAKIGYMMLAVLIAAPIAYYLIAASKYRLERILTFLDPLAVRYGSGYQLTQSLFGFSAGGIFGTGLGDGLQKFYFLPEAHNDFIAAIIGEELGVLGICIVLALFCVVVARGVVISLRADDELGTYIGFGLTALLGVQVLANLSVGMGLIPTKGLNLPFISYGGSAITMSLFAIGILLNISRSRSLEVNAQSTCAGSANIRRPAAELKGADG